MKIKRDLKNKIVIAVSTLIATIVCLTLQYAQKEKQRIASLSQEMQRAMNYEQFADEDAIVEETNKHVQFSAFFLRDLDGDGYAEKLKGTCKEIGKQDTLYMDINVLTKGYLKDAKIEIQGNNFYYNTVLPKDNELKDSYIGSNIKTIEFNQLNNGTQKTLMGFVKSGDYTYSSKKYEAIGNNINNYSRDDNKIILTGTYYEAEGTEGIAIRKEITLNIDWYGTTKAEIPSYFNGKDYQNQEINIANRVDEENRTLNLDFDVVTTENNNELLLSKNQLEAEIPELNGYAPTKVEVSGTNIEYSYDAESKKLTITKIAEVDAEGKVVKNAYDNTYREKRHNKYNISVIYPIEAYQSLGEDTVTIKIPAQTYYEGYNNTNTEFTNPYKSNIAKATIVANYKKPEGTAALVEVTVGKNVYNPTRRYIVSKAKPIKIYNQVSEEEKNDNYTVRWYVTTGTDGASTGLTLKETKNGEEQKVDHFIKTDSTEDSMEDATTNDGIYFTGADQLLKEDGWIKVYDEETDELIATFTKDNWSKYTEGNPYKYETSVKHIRVQTSETNASSSLYVYNIKTLDDSYITEKYTRDQFDNLNYIKSTLTGYLGSSYINTDTHQAIYEAPYSAAEISLSNNTISTQVTEKNEKITITAQANENENKIGWKNGSFLVKIPSEILTTEINNITINNNNVQITSYELLEDGENEFIKINTENKNNNNESYIITIDTNTTPDPRSVTVSRYYELYATNEAEADYYYKEQDIYDVNNNLNTEEIINRTETSIKLVSPNSLLTNQTITEYDEKGSIAVSPQIADVTPIYANVDNKKNKATIGVQVKNNYSSDISEVLLLGKIPFEGNTYAITGDDLGSSFTTKMKGEIEVPEELQGKVTIYYSENENPSRDLSNEENGWKTGSQVTDWNKIKTYVIDFGDTVLTPQKEYVFNYKVSLPNGVDFNKVSYAHHGIYFALHTDQGKYRTQTEPNKIGVRVAQKYNLELTKYQTGKDKKISGATYSVIAEGEEEGKTATTDANGVLQVNNLYAEKTYIIKEIKSPTDYELNSNEIKFVGHVNQDTGILTVEKKEGNTKGNMTVTKVEGEDYKVNVEVEDEVKAKLKITKTEQGTETKIAKVTYTIKGEGLPEAGRRVITNINGEANLSGLKIGKEYILEEVKAEGYYLASPVKFTINNNNGTYTISINEGTVKTSTITEEDSLPIGNISIEDEKIPTYNLELTKIKKVTNVETSQSNEGGEQNAQETTYLAGAKFRLYKGDEKIGDYISDENGKIEINDLYQYVAGKEFEATYTLKEILPPEGYAKVKDITFKVERNEEGKLEFKEDIEEGQTAKTYTTDERSNTVKVTVEDSPSFKLTKQDGETEIPLANCKFAIYNVDESQRPATNSKGEILGEKQTINGQEYYVLTTDEAGEITADLPEGFYKAVEVEAPEQYDLQGQTYYFGIGASREPQTIISAELASSIGDHIDSVAETADGGYIAGGRFSGIIQIGDTQFTSNGNDDGIVIKYTSEGEVEWAKSIGGTSRDHISLVAATQDGGYIAGGDFEGTIQVGNTTLISNGDYDVLLIKYSSNGEVEWAKNIGGTSTDYISSVAATIDGGYIAGGESYNRTNGYMEGIVIKYTSEGEVEWAKNIGDSGYNSIYSVAGTQDGGYIVGGYFEGTIQAGDTTLTSNGVGDGLIIKYSSEGEVEWAKSIGGSDSDYIQSVTATTDGGYIAGGYSYSSTIQVGDTQLTGNGYSKGLIIKYSSEGEAEWAKNIRGGDYGYNSIYSVAGTQDGGYIVGGYFSGAIQVGDTQFTSNGNDDGIVIKYTSEGEVEWAKSIGGISGDVITTVTGTTNGSYIVGGYFYSSTMQVGNTQLINKGGQDGFVIKYSPKEIPEIYTNWATSIGGNNDDSIQSVGPTADGGYIAGGYFEGTIQVEDTTLISNGNYDGLLIKYSSNGEVEWARNIGGASNDRIYSVTKTTDGGYIVGGYFEGTMQAGDTTLTSHGKQDGLAIKYSSEGEVEWARNIGGNNDDSIESVASTADGGYIVGGYFRGTMQAGDTTLTSNGYDDGIVIKYTSEGEVEWAKNIGGNNDDSIQSVTATTDGGYIVGGYFRGTMQAGDTTLTSHGKQDGLAIKYSSEGEVEWATSIGENYDDSIQSVTATTEGGYIVGGYFQGTLQAGDTTLISNGFKDGIVIKYTSEGEVEWAKNIGGNNDDRIQSVASTADGGCIAGGYFEGTIQVGDVILKNNYGYTLDTGFIIKYDKNEKVEWGINANGSYKNYIQSVGETKNNDIIIGGNILKTVQLGNKKLVSNGGDDGFIAKLTPIYGATDQSELEVINNRKEYIITTDVKEIDGTKGGSISGEDKKPYETVKYGDNSTNEIKMTPDENYEIIGITVNGEEWPYSVDENGNYTMPQFENITENKHIVVTYSSKNNKITINKVNKNTGVKLPNATFKLDQIEERAEPENVVGNLTDNSDVFDGVDKENEINGILGNLTSNGNYYFVEQDGKYVPTNSKTWQTANVEGATKGVRNTTANSYIELDLTDKTGKYAVVVNAEVSSEGSDYGYATITNSTTAPTYNTGTGRFMYISGTKTANDFISDALEGGQKYYIHLGYRKNESIDKNQDQVVINSVKVYSIKTTTYNFTENEGKYESTNQGNDRTTSNSYIPIDLTGKTGKYNLTVNAEISSESYDYGYATITEAQERVEHSTREGRFIHISGEQEAKDYTKELDGGKLYYLHLGYYKNESTSSGNDKFTVNSIKVTLNDSELYHTEVTTNSEGKAITQIPFGKYKVTEISAPNGYAINEAIPDIEFRAGGEHEFTIEDEPYAKVKVHHYEAIKNVDGTYTYTERKLAEDELKEDEIGAKYTTTPNMNIPKYTLLRNNTGKYVIPENSTGEFTAKEQEVNYYYEQGEIPLTVHHYIEGTEVPVPLKNGGEAEDVTDSGKEGDEYTTSSISNEDLAKNYELVEVPTNANGTYKEDEVIVTYYYREIRRDFTLIKYDEDERTPLGGATFEIKDEAGEAIGEYTTDGQGKIKASLGEGTYKVKEKHAPDGYALDETEYTITITRDTTDEKIEISNEKKRGTVTVHYYLQEDDGTPTTTPIKLANGNNAEDLNKSGIIGDIYATEPHSSPAEYYELVSATPFNSSGEYIDGNIEVTYYYKLKDCGYTVEYYYDNVKDESKTETSEAKYGSKITTYTDKIVEGYKLEKKENLPLTISENPDNNIIKIYYVKRNNLQYTVNYLEKGTNKVLHDAKTVENKTLQDVVNSRDEVIEISTYNYDSADKESLSIGADNTKNVINLYYTKKDGRLVVKYVDVNTNEEIATADRSTGKVGEDYTTRAKTIEGYTVVESMLPENATGKYAEEEAEVIYKYVKNTNVIVKYVDKITGQEITRQITIPGHEGDNYSTEQKEFDNYEFVEVKGNKEGKMAKEPIEVIYYYIHNSAGVEVNYLDVNTNEPLAGQDIISGKEGESYTTAPKAYQEGNTETTKLKDYDLVEERLPENANGTMKKELTVVNYYYAKKTNVIVRYVDKTTGEELTTPITIPGHEGDLYTTETKDFTNYVLVEVPTNKDGKMTDKTTEVTYYYIHVSAGVIEKHFDEHTGQLLDSKTYEGNEGDIYATSAKTFAGYDLNENRLPSNATGTMRRDVIEVDYYYNYKTRVTTRYIDKITNKPLTESVTQEGHEGESYTTERKVFENYKLVKVPTNADGKMTKEPTVVTYYYVHDSAGVKVNHYDVITGEKIIAEETISGNEGDKYTTSEKEFEEYDIVEERYPANKEGTMTKEETRVDYYYIHKAKVTTKYIDKITGEELTPSSTENRHEGEKYTTERKEFDNYKLVEVPTNANGEMTKEPTEVIYYYVHESAGVKVNHYDVISGEKIIEEETIKGYEGDSYETKEKEYNAEDEKTSNFKSYDLVREKYPTNAKGTMKIEETSVNYYYIKKSTVKVKYVDKVTGEELTEEIVITGNDGDDYTTEEKKFEGYDIVEDEYPENTKGKIKKDPAEVIYYYKKKTEVVSEYIEKETNEKIETDETIKGHEGENYETLKKEIEYYELIEEPENSKGKMTADKIKVTYYYRKKTFNLAIDKKVKATIRNGERREINKDITKQEVYSKQVPNTTIKVEYSIVVENKGEISGTAKLEENIPAGMKMLQEENSLWTIMGSTATLTTEEIQPGGSKEYLVMLTWENNKENYGIKENIVKIIETSNKAGFEETEKTDNNDGAKFAITVPTGIQTYGKIAGTVLVILITAGLGIIEIKKKTK